MRITPVTVCAYIEDDDVRALVHTVGDFLSGTDAAPFEPPNTVSVIMWPAAPLRYWQCHRAHRPHRIDAPRPGPSLEFDAVVDHRLGSSDRGNYERRDGTW